MTLTDAQSILLANKQEHILRFWDKLSDKEQNQLLEQIEALDFNAVSKMQTIFANRNKKSDASTIEMRPAPVTIFEGEATNAATRIGEQEIKDGHVAVIVVAGGQGTRLGFNGPKGCFPICPISNESLFYFHSRKILALEKLFDAVIPFYIMTSQSNNAQTVECFEQNNYFGLKKENVFFFMQSMWPALDSNGKIIMESPSRIFMSPDGHGGTLSALKNSGGLADMRKRGIQTVFYFQVDNPMVEIADPTFIGFHKQNVADISVKVCAKRDPEEGLGVVVERNGKTEIVEYTEFTPEQKNERLENGELKYKFGSVAIHIFSLHFLEQEADAGLPLHIAYKKVPYCDETGKIVNPSAPNAYKFEKFIFDALSDAKVVCCLAFDRDQEFSPIKNPQGNDSPEMCRNDLMKKWMEWFDKCGIIIPRDDSGNPKIRIEIDPVFANSSEILKTQLLLSNHPTIDLKKDIWLH